MTAIRRRSLRGAIGASAVLATADDLDGTTDNSQVLDVSGCSAAIVFQRHDGTPGTAGIDVIEESHDGGITWAACTTAMLLAGNPHTGTILVAGAINAAGVDTVGGYVLKCGPFRGPAMLRIGRKTTTTTGTTWLTGAPSVDAAAIR
jgi:hypothetical protein